MCLNPKTGNDTLQCVLVYCNFHVLSSKRKECYHENYSNRTPYKCLLRKIKENMQRRTKWHQKCEMQHCAKCVPCKIHISNLESLTNTT